MNTLLLKTRVLVFTLFFSICGLGTLHAQNADCDTPPSVVSDGTFESCQSNGFNCPSLKNYASCGWYVSHGSPHLWPGANSSAQSLGFGSHENLGDAGAYTCFDFQPNTTYKLTFDVRTSQDGPAEIEIYAATGLVVRSGGGPCFGNAPTPTSQLLLATRTSYNNSWESVSYCFTTDNNSYSQLWFQSVYPSSGQPALEMYTYIDNVEFEEQVDFSLALNSQASEVVTVCVPALHELPQIDLQMISDGFSCIVGEYEICITPNGGGVLGSCVDLDAGQMEDLIAGTLDITTLGLSLSSGNCYTITVRSLNGETPSESSITLCLEEDCECNFDEFEIEGVSNENGAQSFSIHDNGSNTSMAGVLWDMGDGTFSRGRLVTRFYPPGTHTVCATIYAIQELTGECCEGEICVEFTIE